MDTHGQVVSHRWLWRYGSFVVACFVVMRWWAASNMPLLGDEAFYWWAGQHLDWSYSDLPPATAWLSWLGASIWGQSYFGVRFPFLVLGLSLVPLLRVISRELNAPMTWPQAWVWAGTLPLLQLTGTMALPEAPLLALSLLLVWQLLRCLRFGRAFDWLLVGLIGALGWLIHIRFAWVAGGVACAWLIHPSLRAQLTSPGPWLAAVVSCFGLIPIIWFNLEHDLSMLQFQLVDRHPWAFQPEAFLQPLIQLILATPALYVLAFCAAWLAIRQTQSQRRAILGGVVVVPWIFIVVFGIFADQDRTTYHWPLFTYVVALPLVHAFCFSQPDRRRWFPWAVVPGLLVGIVLSGLMYLTVQAPSSNAIPRKLVIDNLMGWQEVAATLNGIPPDVPVVADNFMTAAQLAFETDRDIAGVMNHPLNDYHGRSSQLAIWGVDEASFRIASPAIAVWEETALKVFERLTWLERACRHFDTLFWLGDVSIRQGKKRFVLFEASGLNSQSSSARRCDLPPLIELIQVEMGEQEASIRLSGWVVDVDSGVDRVEFWTDLGFQATAAQNFAGRGGTPPFPELRGHGRKYGFVGFVDDSIGSTVWARAFTEDGRYRDSRALPVASLRQRAQRTTQRLRRAPSG